MSKVIKAEPRAHKVSRAMIKTTLRLRIIGNQFWAIVGGTSHLSRRSLVAIAFDLGSVPHARAELPPYSGFGSVSAGVSVAAGGSETGCVDAAAGIAGSGATLAVSSGSRSGAASAWFQDMCCSRSLAVSSGE